MKKLHEIVELGTADCDYTGGGIWVAYMSVLIDGEKAELWYDSESYKWDDKNAVEFTVYDEDGTEMLTQYFDNGLYIGSRKDSPYLNVFDKLHNALQETLSNERSKQ